MFFSVGFPVHHMLYMAAQRKYYLLKGLEYYVMIYLVRKRLYEYYEYYVNLLGRGYTDAPDVSNTENVFVDQLWQLLSALNLLKTPFHLCGVSMGGGIATAFSSRYPSSIKTLSLMAPAGLNVSIGLLLYLLRIPILADCLMIYLFEYIQVSGAKKRLDNPVSIMQFQTDIKQHPGNGTESNC